MTKNCWRADELLWQPKGIECRTLAFARRFGGGLALPAGIVRADVIELKYGPNYTGSRCRSGHKPPGRRCAVFGAGGLR